MGSIKFGKPAGAGSAAASTPAQTSAAPQSATPPAPAAAVGEAPVAPEQEAPKAAATIVEAPVPETAKPVGGGGQLVVPRSGTTSLGFSVGTEEDTEIDPRDVKLPRLNLVQDMSAESMKAVAKVGEFVYRGALRLPQPLTIVVCGFRPKRFVEKVKFGSTPRYAANLQEVMQLGGIDEWRQSKENEKSGSNKPWFMPMVTALVLIQQPDGLPEEHFTIEADGKLYAPALFTVKSTSYGSFFVPLQSEKVSGLMRSGYFTRFVELTSAKNKAFEPRVRVLGETSDAVRRRALEAAGA